MEEMEREWKGVFRPNGVAHANLHSYLSSYDRILPTSLLSHRSSPPLCLPDPPPPPPLSPSPNVLGPRSSSLQPQQLAVVLASHRNAGLEMANGHKHKQDNVERRACANGYPNTITKYKEVALDNPRLQINVVLTVAADDENNKFRT